MKIALAVVFFLNLTVALFSQDTITRYWLEFTDKGNTNFSFDYPELFLSERAIKRRNDQAIELDSLDLPVSQFYIQSVLSAGNITLWGTSKWMNGIVVKTQDTLALDSIVNYPFVSGSSQLKKNSIPKRVNKFSDSPLLSTDKLSILNTPYYPFGLTYNQHHLHGSDLVQQMGFNGRGIHIAVLDAGFKDVDQTPALAHLFNENRLLSTFDFVRNETSVYEDHNHGEAVLSIIAGDDPGYYLGSASKASFHLLISEDVFSESIVEEYYWVVAAEYADSCGVDIINTSLGYTVFDDSTTNHTYAQMDGNTTIAAKGVNIASAKGMLCVTSAGNSGSSPWKYISTPADADLGLTVGAVDSNGLRAPFSSQGPSYDGDVKPNVMSVGWNTYYIPPGADYANQGNGTSFSAPMVTGMVAALWEAMPELTNMELIHLLESNSHMHTNPDSLMGYGIPNIYRLLVENSNYEYLIDSSKRIKNIFPNPFVDQLSVFYESDVEMEVELKLIALTAKQLYSEKFTLQQGLNKMSVNLSSRYSPGFYFLIINDEVVKLIKAG